MASVLDSYHDQEHKIANMQPLNLPIIGNNEKSDSNKVEREVADTISHATALHPDVDNVDAITDPDEYRLRHPFGGMKMNSKLLADTLNGWENNN